MPLFGEFFNKKKKAAGEPAEASKSQSQAKISDCLSADTILILDIPGRKSELLKKLVDLICVKRPDIPVKTAFQAVMEREKVTTTFMDKGVAVPHARLPKIDRIYAALALLRNQIDEEKEDTASKKPPTKIVFLFLSPQGEFAAHLQVLSKASWIFQSDSFKDKLLSSSTPQDILNLIQIAEK